MDLGDAENRQLADAPVSYPVIWDAHQQDFSAVGTAPRPTLAPGPCCAQHRRGAGRVRAHGVHCRARGPSSALQERDARTSGKPEIAPKTILTWLASPQWPGPASAVDRRGEGDRGRRPLREALRGAATRSSTAAIPTGGSRPTVGRETAHVGDGRAGSGELREAHRRYTGAPKGTAHLRRPAQAVLARTAPAGDVLRKRGLRRAAGLSSASASPRPHGLVVPPGAECPRCRSPDWKALEQKVKDQETALKTLVAGNPKQLTVPMYKARPTTACGPAQPAYLHNGPSAVCSRRC